jgi:hypothetical protein
LLLLKATWRGIRVRAAKSGGEEAAGLPPLTEAPASDPAV